MPNTRPIHSIAFAIARSLPHDVALTLAVMPEGTVSIEGVPGGLPSDREDHQLLRDAARAMTYTCSSCTASLPVDKFTRDSVMLEMCAACEYEGGLENEHQDGYHDPSQDGFHADCPMCGQGTATVYGQDFPK